jgi:hypothetical protein
VRSIAGYKNLKQKIKINMANNLKNIKIKNFIQTTKTNKKNKCVCTPKLKWHIVSNVARNTIPWDEESKCAKAKASPKL